MRTKILTLAYTPSLAAIDDSPLTDFVRDKEVLSLREYYFEVHGLPHLLCVIDYADVALASAAQRTPNPRKDEADGAAGAASAREDAGAKLAASDRALYATLKSWRNERARADGVPPYILFTNAELARIVAARPQSATALSAIDGLGPGKVRRYGEAMLVALNGAAPEATSAPERGGESPSTSADSAPAPTP